MKRVQNTHADLRRIFESAITVRDIAEPVVCYDAERNATEVKPFLDEYDFDLAGVRQNGRVLGYVHRKKLMHGRVEDHLVRFGSGEIVPETEPLVQVFQGLRVRPAFFVTAFGQVAGIVTRGDLQKSPVRMWLFGLISLIEMQMLRVIRERHPSEAWETLLKSKKGLKTAQWHFQRRRARNEAIDLACCLSLSDKADIFRNDPPLDKLMRCSGLDEDSTFFSELVDLRDDLAHAHDIISNRWPRLARLVQEAERLLNALEQASF
jgi:hypothetical protein